MEQNSRLFAVFLRSDICRLGAFALAFSSTHALASLDPPTGPSNSADGNYAVNYPWDDADPGCDWVELQESDDGGTTWNYVPDTNKDGSVTFTSHPFGEFEYRS